MIAKSAIIDPAIADAAFALASGEVSQPVQGRFGVALVKVGKIEAGTTPTYESVAAIIKKEVATANARAKVNELQGKMEDERGGGASIAEAAQKLGLTAVTIDAVDRSGRMPNGQLVANIPRGLDVVSQAFNSDVGVDNDPIQFQGGYVWYDVLGITPSRERTLDEVRDQVEAKWREDQIASRLRTKAAEMVKKLEGGGNLADEAAARRLQGRDREEFQARGHRCRRAFRRGHRGVPHAKDGVGQSGSAAANGSCSTSPTSTCRRPMRRPTTSRSCRIRCSAALTDEQVAQYVTKIEAEIGTSINQAAFAQATGANDN